MALELHALLEELSKSVSDDRLKASALRLIHSVKTDQLPSREDMGILLYHLLSERKLQVQTVLPEDPQPRPLSKKPPALPRPPLRPSSDLSGRRSISPEPEPPVGSVFHERIQAVETDEDKAIRRRFGVKRRGR